MEESQNDDKDSKDKPAEHTPKPGEVKKGGSVSRKNKEPPAHICGVLDKFIDSVTELGVAGIKKLYNGQLANYRAPDNLYKFTEFENNKDKNRFLDVVCLDHSRVVLHFEVPPCSNYIHASWIRFEKHDRVFIATQAPMENTIEDFWRMIFQESCNAIINLTNMDEEARFTVYTLEVLPDGCSNSLLLKLIKAKSDTGKSPSTTMILRMLRIVGTSERVATGPVVVHCVSGVGRAGTVILIDVILQRLFTNQLPVDLVEMFRHLRNQRRLVATTRYPGRYREKRDKFKEDYRNSIGSAVEKKEVEEKKAATVT
ncbi:Protein-tyrosine phosphatase [Ostertagia ostertagi]